MRQAVSAVSLRTLLCTLLLASAPLAAQESRSIFDIVKWQDGPGTGVLGLVADVGVPSYCKFADSKGAKTFLQATGNVPSGREVGLLFCDPKRDSSYWFVVFDYDESGYVKDDEKATLDAAKILKSLQDGQIQGNEERRRRGYDELEIAGWYRAPYYDTLTNNLTWSLRVRVLGSTEESINHSVRLLGRRGVMNVDLVADPADMPSAVAAFDSAIAEFGYFTGQTYAEWKPGDKVAEYGLTALVAGGAGLAAAKLGFFSKLWKWIVGLVLALKKFIIVLVVGIGAALKKLFSGRRSSDGGTPVSTTAQRVAYKPPPPVKPPVTGAPAAAAPVAAPANLSSLGSNPETPQKA